MGQQHVVYEGVTTELRETDAFAVLNARAEYNFRAADGRFMTLYAGVDNIFDSYQEDLPTGEDRPAGYVYGPSKPLTIYFGARMGI
jgi:outer membrane receptor for ferrienterochelin and colicins